MSSSSELLLVTQPLRGDDARALTPARLDADLRTSPYAAARVDPRLTVPALADVVDAAARSAAEEGHAAGYAAGYAEGRRAAALEAEAAAATARRRAEDAEMAREHRFRRMLEQLAEVAGELRHREAVELAELEEALTQAAVDLAEILLGRELSLTTTPGQDALARALDLCPGTAPVVVRLHPDDLAGLGGLEVPGRDVRLVADPSLDRGDCVADSAGRHVDARLAPAVERLRAALQR